MRIVVPYTKIVPDVIAALDNTGAMYELRDVSSSDSAYWTLMNALWHEQEAFVIVEHDVVVKPSTIEELKFCPETWCSFRVPYLTDAFPGLSCTKFSDKLMKAIPDAMERTATMSDPTHPPKHWCRVDGWLRNALMQAGFQIHIHEGILGHIRDDGESPYPSHGCIQRT